MKIRTGWLYPLLVVAVLAGAVLLRVADPFSLQALRSIAFDTYQRLQPASYNVNTPVRIVAIDDQSLERIGQWPWPDEVMAKLLRNVTAQGPAVVAFDILFPSSGDTGSVFAEAVASAPVVLALAPTNLPTDDPVPDLKATVSVSGADALPFIPSFANVEANGSVLDGVATGLGATAPLSEQDGLLHRLPLVSRVGARILPALGLEVLRVAQGSDAYLLEASDGEGLPALARPPGLSRITVGDISVPTDPDGGMRLDLRPSNPEAYIPAWRVLEGDDVSEAIEGRIVAIGLTAAGVGDFVATPLERSIARVEFQAEAIEHILSGRTVTRLGDAVAIEIGVVILLGLLLAWLLPRLKLVVAVAAGLVVVAGIAAAGWFAYRDFGLVFDPTWPVLSLWVLAALTALYLHHRLEMRRAEARAAFGGSMAPAMVDAVLRHPDRLVLDGETREVTLMHCAIRHFGAIAEHFEAKDLVSFVNWFNAPLADAIHRNHGMLSSSKGDSLIAVWNAPLDDELHATNACRAAAAIQAGIRHLDRGEAARATVGIGIATGNCCVGRVGAGERSGYLALGESVDLAEHLQRLSEFYGAGVVVDETTVARMREPQVLELDLIRVRGRSRPIRIFVIAGAIEEAEQVFDRLAPVHAAMIGCYRDRDWDGAAAALTQCLAFRIERLLTLYSLYRSRIATCREIPPPMEWDGADATLG